MRDPRLPKGADNDLREHRTAIWLLGVATLLRLLIASPSMLDGADSIPLGAVSLAAAHKLLSIFSLLELQQVLVALVHIVVFFGYPALMPLIFRVLLVERLGHTLVLTLQPGAPTNPNAPSHYIALSLLTMIEARFALSFRRDTARGSPPR